MNTVFIPVSFQTNPGGLNWSCCGQAEPLDRMLWLEQMESEIYYQSKVKMVAVSS